LGIHYQSYIWAAHLTDVEEAWDRATEPNMDLTSGATPISPQLYQTEAPLEDVLAPSQLAESLVCVLVSPFSEEPPEHELALPQLEAPPEDGHVSPQLVESLVHMLAPPPHEEPPESVPVVTLPGDHRRVLVEEAPSEREVLSPLKLLLNEVAVLGSIPRKFLFAFLPSWSRSSEVASGYSQLVVQEPRSLPNLLPIYHHLPYPVSGGTGNKEVKGCVQDL